MAQLRANFAALSTSKDDPQARGYSLEDLLVELFEVHEIRYGPPYRTRSAQIDGHFNFNGFDYLVEARWRAEPPTESDLAIFQRKFEKPFQSNRGMFVSIAGFRPEVVIEFTRGNTSNLFLVDGSDLSLIVEGQVSLTDALTVKIEKAVQEGIIFFPLVKRFSA